MANRSNTPDDLTEALSAPLGDLIAAVGRGVGEAQRAMDAATIASIRDLNNMSDDIGAVMRSIGYRPNWYQIPKVDAELTVSLSIGGDTTASDGRLRLYAAPTDASYTNKYSFDLQAVSKLKFTVVAVPPTPEQAGLRVMPLTADRIRVGELVATLESLRIPYMFEGSGQPPDDAEVERVEPPAGTILTAGQSAKIFVLPVVTQDVVTPEISPDEGVPDQPPPDEVPPESDP